MKLLVTGGLGFIGSSFIHYWFRNHPNDSIINLDKVTYAANFKNVGEIKGRYDYSFVKGDICNAALVSRLVMDVDAVINFAAETHVDNSIKNPSAFIRSNVVGVYRILNAVKKNETRFHHVSTDEVYGSLGLNSDKKFTEESRYDPRNPYAATKAAADHLVKAYYNTYKLPVTISNCSNNYGPRQHVEKLIPKTIINAIKNKPIPVYGNGMQVRDWIYVEDHCSALEKILGRGEYGETYLVSADGEKRNIDVVRSLLKLLNKNDALIQFVKDRPGHDKRYALNSSKIKNDLRWKPRFTFDKGLKLTIKHYKRTLKR